MTGNDVLFGDGQDDDIVGGYGDDWISGGTGDDGIIGDDGRITTSRNSSTGWTATGTPCTANAAGTCFSEPLYGIAALLPTDPDTRLSNGNVLNEFVYTPGKMQTETINVAGVLNKTVNLTPFNVDPQSDTLFRPEGGYDDIIFGGLGVDVIHGGSGDDALSGAEALDEGYAPKYTTSCGTGTTPGCVAVRDGLIRIDFGHPVNPGDVLRYNPDRRRRLALRPHPPGRRVRPLRRVRAAPGDPVQRCGRPGLDLHRLHPERPHLHLERPLANYPFHWFLTNSWDEGPVYSATRSVPAQRHGLPGEQPRSGDRRQRRPVR